MARTPRNTKKEYQQRKQLARNQGYPSLYSKNQTAKFASLFKDEDGNETLGSKYATQISKKHGAKGRDLYMQGFMALGRGDHQEANKIARKLGYKVADGDDPERIFYYHPDLK